MNKHSKKLPQMGAQEVQQKRDWKSTPLRDKWIAIIALGLILTLSIGIVYVLIVGSDFVYREEQQMDKIANYIFIPMLIIVALVALAKKSLSALVTGLLICGLFVYPAMESVVMFLNVKIGKQQEELISGVVIEKKMTGNRHITKHYKVRTDKGDVYTFMYEGHVTSYAVNDPFHHLMKRGCLGILYQEFKKK